MDKKLQQFLAKIAQIESAGGKNINHPMVTVGRQKGQTAIGQYGLLPNTVKEILRMQAMKGTTHPDTAPLADKSDDEIRALLLSRPDLQDNLASTLAQHVMKRQHNDPVRAAYAWNHGTNLHYLPDEKLADDEYVNRFKRIKNAMAPDQVPQLQEDNTRIPQEAKNLLDNKMVASNQPTDTSDLDTQLATQLLESPSSEEDDEDNKSTKWKQMAALLKGSGELG